MEQVTDSQIRHLIQNKTTNEHQKHYAASEGYNQRRPSYDPRLYVNGEKHLQ